MTTWRTEAKCLNEHPELFEATQIVASQTVPGALRLQVAQAKKICITECPVRAKCLEAAMEEEAYLGGTERFGIRGGLTARQRLLNAAKNPLCSRCGENPVTKWQRVYHIRRICRSCQRQIGEGVERFFPEGVDEVVESV